MPVRGSCEHYWHATSVVLALLHDMGRCPERQSSHNSLLKPMSHQPCGSCAPIRVDKFLDFVRQPYGVVYYTARLPYEKQGRKAAATNFRHVHFLCDLLAFSERCTTAARHTRLPQGCRKTAARHARCSYD